MKMPSAIEINLKSGECWVIDLSSILNAGDIVANFYTACRASGISDEVMIGFKEA